MCTVQRGTLADARELRGLLHESMRDIGNYAGSGIAWETGESYKVAVRFVKKCPVGELLKALGFDVEYVGKIEALGTGVAADAGHATAHP